MYLSLMTVAVGKDDSIDWAAYAGFIGSRLPIVAVSILEWLFPEGQGLQ